MEQNQERGASVKGNSQDIQHKVKHKPVESEFKKKSQDIQQLYLTYLLYIWQFC